MGTATLAIRTGRPAGARTRRSGAAPRSRWAALCLSHTIATRGILIGRLDGVQTRRWGARRSVAIEHPAHEQAAGVRSRIEAACDVYVHNYVGSCCLRLTVADCLVQARDWQSYSRALHKQTVTADVRR